MAHAPLGNNLKHFPTCCATTSRAGANQPVHWFFGDKGFNKERVYGLIRPNPLAGGYIFLKQIGYSQSSLLVLPVGLPFGPP